MNDIVGQGIFHLAIVTLPGPEENQRKGELRQTFDYLVHPAGNPASDKRVGAFQQECDVGVFLLLHQIFFRQKRAAVVNSGYAAGSSIAVINCFTSK